MEVFLTHAYFLEHDPREREIMKPYPPLGLLYLSAWLDRFGVENAVFDTTFSDEIEQRAHILAAQPPVLAVYANLITKQRVVELMEFVRQNETLNRTLIVLGGPDVRYNAAEYLASGADLLILGEGEQSLLEVVLSARLPYENSNLSEAFGTIEGLAFRFSGEVVFTPPRTHLRDLDEMPLPNRHKIDLRRYLSVWKNAHGYSALSISTQRGCPYTCRWCSTAVYGQSYRRRSPQAVVDEITHLQVEYDFDLIWFVDDVFTVSHKWLTEFERELCQRRVTIRFECITRADRLNETVMHTLRNCGCFRVWIGAESGSQRIIDAMERRVDLNQVRAMFHAARNEGIESGTFIMLGYPGETEADIVETIRHLKTGNPDIFTITVAYPIKGTALYESVKSTIRTPDLPWSQYTDRDLDFKRTYSRRYYDYAVRYTVNAVQGHRLLQKKSWWNRTVIICRLKAALARAGMLMFKKR